MRKKKYIVELHLTYGGRVVIKATTKIEAEEIGEYIMDKQASPYWYEWGSQGIENVKEVKTAKDLKLIKEQQLPNKKKE